MGLQLMGFKPLAALQAYHNIKNPSFIYPDEAAVSGSTVAFRALLEEMDRTRTFAVARLVFRKTGIPRFVALVPQMEKLDEAGDDGGAGAQLLPPGMNVIPLPYADEIRRVKTEDDPPTASAELVAAATRVVRALRLPSFEPDDFSNPALQRHYKVLEALALHDELRLNPTEDDRIVPDADGFSAARGVLQHFGEKLQTAVAALPPPTAAPAAARKAPAAASKKRAKAEADDDGDFGAAPAPKQAKAAAAAGNVDLAAWTERCANGEVERATVAELKEVLKAVNLKVGGAKAELVERVRGHFLGE